MSQALYRKWRPARFDQVIGQEHVTHTLQNSIMADRIGHAYLFCGPRGTGKTTSARLVAKAVNCLHEDLSQRPCDQCRNCIAINEGRFLDLIEIDAASNTGVDDIRDLRDKINFAPSEGTYKVYIIDEVHMLSTAAFNALLKTLEEPPAHAKFVLATTEEHKVPLTIKSRCQQFNFRLLTMQEIIQRLRWLAETEGLNVEEGVYSLVAQHGAGSLRDSESLLDQLVGAPDAQITIAQAQSVLGTAATGSVASLTEAILTADSSEGLAVIHQALSTGTDARQYCRQMVTYLRDLLLIQTTGGQIELDMPIAQKEALIAQAQRARRETLVQAIKHFNEAAVNSSTNWQPQLPLELAFIQSLPAEEYVPMQAAIQPVRTVASTVAPVVADVPATATPPAVSPPPMTQQTAVSTPPPPPPSYSAPSPQTAPRQPAPPPISESQAPPAAPQFDLSQIKGKAWREFVAQASQKNRNFKNWLNSSQPMAFEGNTLVLGFDLDFLAKKVEAERDVIATVLSAVLNAPSQVRCVLKDEYSAPASTQKAVSFQDEVEDLAKELGGVVRSG